MSAQRDEALGAEMMGFVERLYPICRSITGDGVRETLAILSELAPIEVHEVPSGTPVLDWVVPDEWNVRDAWIKDAAGRRVVDFRAHNLHLVSYSTPIGPLRLPLAELRQHLHSLPEHPDWIPYRTSYYERDWGFCLPHRVLESLPDGEYEVCIEGRLEPGHLTYGECLVPGASEDEILITAHVCHPSLCDDNLSGAVVAACLARELAQATRRHSVRFLFAPGTIGAITWLARNRERLARVRAGLTLQCLGDAHAFTYKKTFAGDAVIDRAAAHVLRHQGAGNQVIEFFPYGYDERQFNAPGFRLPMGALMRGRHGRFPEYHTSADDLGFVSGARLAEALATVRAIVAVVDGDQAYRNLCPYGEPQLGRRGLYQAIGGAPDTPALQMALLWVLACSDGAHRLLDVAERSGLPFATVRTAADLLLKHDLLAEIPDEGTRH